MSTTGAPTTRRPLHETEQDQELFEPPETGNSVRRWTLCETSDDEYVAHETSWFTAIGEEDYTNFGLTLTCTAWTYLAIRTRQLVL